MQYGILASRSAASWLFPMPDSRGEDTALQDQDLQNRYLTDQRIFLRKEYTDAIAQFIEKYIVLFNRIIPVPAGDAPDEYFMNTDEAVKRRRQDVYDALNSDSGEEYRRMIRESGFRFRYVELINEMLHALDELRIFRNDESKADMIATISGKLEKASGDLKAIQDKLNQGTGFNIADYERIQKSFSFQRLTKDFFDMLNRHITEKIDSITSLDDLDNLELDIIEFCRKQDIPENSSATDASIKMDKNARENEYISQDVLGENEKDERTDRYLFDQMLEIVKEYSDSVTDGSGRVEFLVRGDSKFDLYFKNARLQDNAFKSRTLAILDDHSFSDSDLFIASDGIVPVKHNRISGMYDFDLIEYQGRSLTYGWPNEYSNWSVNIGNLYTMIEKLRELRNTGRENNQNN